jgi:hypothetical protein
MLATDDTRDTHLAHVLIGKRVTTLPEHAPNPGAAQGFHIETM